MTKGFKHVVKRLKETIGSLDVTVCRPEGKKEREKRVVQQVWGVF